jgi:hypothetical protein
MRSFNSGLVRSLFSSVISSFFIMCFVLCSKCLRPRYLVCAHDVSSLRILANFHKRFFVMLDVLWIECQAWCIISFASVEMSQWFSKRNVLDLVFSIFLNRKVSGA